MEEINYNRGQVLTEFQLKHICKQAFNFIDMRGCEGLSKGELVEFMEFVESTVYMHQTKHVVNEGTGEPSSNFDKTSVNALYDKCEKKIYPIKKLDTERIIKKLGEDAFDGVSSTDPQGTRYEERVQFKELWSHMLPMFEKDGVLYKPFKSDVIHEDSDE